MATSSFFYTPSTGLSPNTVDQLIDSLNSKLELTEKDRIAAEQAAAEAGASASNASLAEFNVATLASQAQSTLTSAQAAVITANASVTTATNNANAATAKAVEAAASAADALVSKNAAAASAGSVTAGVTESAANAVVATAQAVLATSAKTAAEAAQAAAASSASGIASSVSAAAASAVTSAASATDSATAATLANDWASKTSAPVAGGEYSAKYNAQQASSSATAAAGSATAASSSATTASAAVTAAQAAQTATAALYDAFDDRYLGTKSSAPSVDNDGNALIVGSIYFNSTLNELQVWNGTGWQGGVTAAGGTVSSFNSRTGSVSLLGSDVTTALGYTPVNKAGDTITGAVSVTPTWNAVGTTFTGLKVNATDTASAADSLLADLQVAGSSVFKVDKRGDITFGDSAGDYQSQLNVPHGFKLRVNNSDTVRIDTMLGAVNVPVALTDMSGDGANWVYLHKDAGGILAQRNSTNPQAFRVYNTYTDGSNYERGFIRWDTNKFEIGTESAGTGTARYLKIPGIVEVGSFMYILNDVLYYGGFNSPTSASSAGFTAKRTGTFNFSSSDAASAAANAGLSSPTAGIVKITDGSTGNGALQAALVRETRIAMPANAIDLLAGAYFTKTITGATTLTVSNTAAAGAVSAFVLDLTNGGAGAVTYFSGVKWAGGTAPVLTAAGRDSIAFFTHDGGTTWTGLLLGKDIK